MQAYVGKRGSRAEAWWWNFKILHMINHINHKYIRTILIITVSHVNKIITYMQNIFEFHISPGIQSQGIQSPGDPVSRGSNPLGIQSPGDPIPKGIKPQLTNDPQTTHMSSLYRWSTRSTCKTNSLRGASPLTTLMAKDPLLGQSKNQDHILRIKNYKIKNPSWFN